MLRRFIKLFSRGKRTYTVVDVHVPVSAVIPTGWLVCEDDRGKTELLQYTLAPDGTSDLEAIIEQCMHRHLGEDVEFTIDIKEYEGKYKRSV